MGHPSRSIFICYRRDDTRHVSGRLRDRLIDEFGPNAVFMDVDTIRPGADFTAVIDDALKSCRIVLVVIGQTWLTCTNSTGQQRIWDPTDHVSVEIVTSLRQSLPMLPVLADGARMPARHELPGAMADLATRNAVRVDHESFGRDSAVVVQAVSAALRPNRSQRYRFLVPLAAAGMLLLTVLAVLLFVTPFRDRTVTARVLTGHVGAVTAATTAIRDGRPVAITAGNDDLAIRIWDLVSGEPVGSPLTGHTDLIHSLATATLDGRTVIVSSSNDATIRVWDLETGAPVGQPRTGSDAINEISTAALDGRPVVVTTTNADKVFVVDLASDQPLGPPLPGHNGGLLASATGALDGRPMVVTLDAADAVQAWDLRTEAPIGKRQSCHFADNSICTMALAELNRRPVIVTGAPSGAISAYDVATGDPIGNAVPAGSGGAPALVGGTLDGRAIVASTGTDGTVQIWGLDVDGLTKRAPPLPGTTTAIDALAFTEVGSDPILVAGAVDGTVHIWNLHTQIGS
jgi:WD40 repeat protein